MTDWAPDEETKQSCQSKGKSEVVCSASRDIEFSVFDFQLK